MQRDHKINTILLLTTPFRPNIGGVETHLDDLVSEGIQRGWKYAVLTYQPLVTNVWGEILEKKGDYIVFRIPWFRFNLFLRFEKYPILEFIYLFPPLFFIGFIYLLISGSKIRKIHSQGLIAGAVGVLLGKIFCKKVIISTHSIYNFPKQGFYSKFVKFLLINCEKILCLSHQSRQEILNLGVDEQRVIVFTYWVDQTKFRPISKKINMNFGGKNSENFICLFIGRLVEGKGIPELLVAATSLKKQIKFVIIGDGPLEKLIIETAQSLPNLVFKGKITNDKLPEYYNSADVLLVPSTHEEGYGRVILEALSCGLPIIATNRGGIKEYVNKQIGILINVSPKNIQKALIFLFKNRNKLLSMKKEAHNYAKIHFNKINSGVIFDNYE